VRLLLSLGRARPNLAEFSAIGCCPGLFRAPVSLIRASRCAPLPIDTNCYETMRSETQQAGRRRRGGRRHRGPRGSYSNNQSSNYSSNGNGTGAKPSAPAKKLGFFQRILAFFTGKPKAPSRPTPATAPKTSANVSSRKPEAEVQPKPTRKPELVEVTSPKLYVGNLSFDAGESDLFELFNGVGAVRNAEVVSHRETQKSKGFAFVTMSSLEEAKRAVLELHDKEFMGRRLVVSGAKTADVREPRRTSEE